MPKIKLTNQATEIEVPEGTNLRDALLKEGVEVYEGINKFVNCMGHSSCGTCRVLIKNDTVKNCSEKTFLEKTRLALSFAVITHEDEMRLSCQVKVNGDIDVETTPIFNYYGKKLPAGK